MPPTKRQMRGSQAVSTFGPGAIVDLRQEAVMMAGTDYWPVGTSILIHEPNLERLLHVDHFYRPGILDRESEGGTRNLPIVRFPRWLVCPQCNRLGDLKLFTSLAGGDRTIKCPNCNRIVYPARLLVACRFGHIDDFPWKWWAHRGQVEECKQPALFLTALGRSAALGDLQLVCKTCKAKTTLAGATRPENLKSLKCQGKRPWLMDEEACGHPLVPLQRGASNVYFGATASSISIPPWSLRLHRALDRHWMMLKAMPLDAIRPTVTDMLLPEQLKTTADELVRAIMDRRAGGDGTQAELTEVELRYRESEALRNESQSDNQDDFSTLATDLHPDLDGLIARVVRVERLREVRALRGFSRVDSPDPSNQSSGLAPLSAKRLNWLPAAEVRGEGIYLELDPDALAMWEQAAEIERRSNLLQGRYEELCARREWVVSRSITPRLVLVHTLAHALIRQLSIESGYSSASLRERLYVFTPDQAWVGSEARAGVLIYTSTADSEGSLGGLVRQGLPARLMGTVLAAVQEAAWCSSDPLCSESEGQGHDAMNMAACHACMLLSETCCEEFNRLLDRATLTGLPGTPEIGYFSPLLGR